MNGVTARLIFVTFIPKHMSENLLRTLCEFCMCSLHKSAYTERMKETYSCLQGHFMFMANWGLINLFNQQLIGF